MNAGIYIGTSKETIQEVKKTMELILSAPVDGDVKIAAFKTLRHLVQPSDNISITNPCISMSAKEN